jgi:hypothetical protein
MLSSVIVCLSVFCLAISVISSQYTQTIDLGSCANFAVQAGTAANFNGVASHITVGDVGVSPGNSITGSYILGSGSTEDNSQAAIQCAADEAKAYLQAQAAVCTTANNLASADLAGVTLGPGVYCSGFMEITASSLTLDGQGNSASVWVFQTASTVTTATSTSVILINGAQASNVFWVVGSAATIGPSASFAGTILAGTAINLSSDAALLGRALSQTAVTCQSGNTIKVPSSSSDTVYPTSSPNPADVSVTDTTTSSSGSGGLSKGAIAGIVIGSVVGAMLICGLILWGIVGGKSFGLGSMTSAPNHQARAGVAMSAV